MSFPLFCLPFKSPHHLNCAEMTYTTQKTLFLSSSVVFYAKL
jgi:hypothetical protein